MNGSRGCKVVRRTRTAVLLVEQGVSPDGGSQRSLQPEDLLAPVGCQWVGVAVEQVRPSGHAAEADLATDLESLTLDLHDGLVQTLFAANLIIGVLPALCKDDPVQGRNRLEELHRLSRGALATASVLHHELQRVDDTDVGMQSG